MDDIDTMLVRMPSKDARLTGTPLSEYPIACRDNPWIYSVTLSSMDTLTREYQVAWTSLDDTWMPTIQLAVVMVSRDNPWISYAVWYLWMTHRNVQ